MLKRRDLSCQGSLLIDVNGKVLKININKKKKKKFEFDWTKHFQVRVRKGKCRRTNGQTNKQNYTNFERNLAMMVIYLPVKFEFDWTNCFRVRVRKRKSGQTDRWTNGQTKGQNYTNFESNLAMMVIYLPVKFEFDWTNRFRVSVRKRKCGRTDGWTNRQKNGQMDRQTNTQNYTNFKRNLAMMVIYVPDKLEFDWKNRFRVRVRK